MCSIGILSLGFTLVPSRTRIRILRFPYFHMTRYLSLSGASNNPLWSGNFFTIHLSDFITSPPFSTKLKTAIDASNPYHVSSQNRLLRLSERVNHFYWSNWIINTKSMADTIPTVMCSNPWAASNTKSCTSRLARQIIDLNFNMKNPTMIQCVTNI